MIKVTMINSGILHQTSASISNRAANTDASYSARFERDAREPE
jgi:hypothetical protein